MTVIDNPYKMARRLWFYLTDYRERRNERLAASLAAVRCAEKARMLAGRVAESKEK